MEMLLEKTKRTVNLKSDMAQRRLKHGNLIYYLETQCSEDKVKELVQRYLAPLHEKLKQNEDYQGCNILLFAEPLAAGSIQQQVGIMFSGCDWDALPDDLEFRHGSYNLCVKNITKAGK